MWGSGGISQGVIPHDLEAAVLQSRRMGSGPLSFTIETDAEASPSAGRLRPEGAEIPFVGWMGLARALEQVLGTYSPPKADSQTDPPPEEGNDGTAQ